MPCYDFFTPVIPVLLITLYLIWQEEFGHFRSLCYAHVDVFILCFSLVNPVSFDNITSKWIPQIRAGNLTSPIVLVGTQSDLCHNVDILIHLDQLHTKPVHFSQARRLKRRIKAHHYVECSALTQHNLKDVFDYAISAAIKHKRTGTKSKNLSLLKRLKIFCRSRKIFMWPEDFVHCLIVQSTNYTFFSTHLSAECGLHGVRRQSRIYLQFIVFWKTTYSAFFILPFMFCVFLLFIFLCVCVLCEVL